MNSNKEEEIASVVFVILSGGCRRGVQLANAIAQYNPEVLVTMISAVIMWPADYNYG